MTYLPGRSLCAASPPSSPARRRPAARSCPPPPAESPSRPRSGRPPPKPPARPRGGNFRFKEAALRGLLLRAGPRPRHRRRPPRPAALPHEQPPSPGWGLADFKAISVISYPQRSRARRGSRAAAPLEGEGPEGGPPFTPSTPAAPPPFLPGPPPPQPLLPRARRPFPPGVSESAALCRANARARVPAYRRGRAPPSRATACLQRKR